MAERMEVAFNAAIDDNTFQSVRITGFPHIEAVLN